MLVYIRRCILVGNELECWGESDSEIDADVQATFRRRAGSPPGADLGGAQGAQALSSVVNWITSLLLKRWSEKLATHTSNI